MTNKTNTIAKTIAMALGDFGRVWYAISDELQGPQCQSTPRHSDDLWLPDPLPGSAPAGILVYHCRALSGFGNAHSTPG